jgi:outer membrane lipoprotein-sorting protein
MKLYVTLTAIGLLLATAAAQTATTQPARATTQPSVDPATRKILDAMEAAGKITKTIRADLTYKTVNTSLGDSEYRTGWVAYQAKQTVKAGGKTITIPPKFRVHFETIRMGRGKTTISPVDYIYDGKTLTIVRTKNKTITRFQLPPGNKGADMLQLGKGPMPLPFGQKTADMIKYFVCTNRPTRTTDPKDTVYVSLVPRKAHVKNLNTLYIHLWVSTKNYLPVKIVTRDKTKNIITSTFSKTIINDAVKKSIFMFAKPRGWKLIVQPFKAGQNFKP